MKILYLIDRWTGKLLRFIPITCLASLFVLIFINVVARVLRVTGFAWFDEAIQGLFAWMVFFGAAALWRERNHFRVDWLASVLERGFKRLVQCVTVGLSIIFFATVSWYGIVLTLKAGALTPILNMPVRLFYISMPVSASIMLAYSIAELFELIIHTKKGRLHNDP